jgi:hypothetical protein
MGPYNNYCLSEINNHTSFIPILSNSATITQSRLLALDVEKLALPEDDGCFLRSGEV